MSDWFQDIDFWHDLAPILFNESNWVNASVEVEQGLSLLRLPEGGSILDLACGQGRHSLEFARRGYRVTAVDLMAYHLEEGRRRAQAKELHVEFIQNDMRAFIRPNAFDAVWNYFSSFGYFSKQEDDEAVIVNIYQSLREGGRLLIETSNWEDVRDFWRENERFEHQPVEDITLIEEGQISDDGSQVFLKWYFHKAGDIKEFNLALRLYSAALISSLLKRAGFTSVDIFGNISGCPYTKDSKRIVVLASK